MLRLACPVVLPCPLRMWKASVEKLKSTLASAYKDMESGRDKFLAGLTEFNNVTTAASSLHMFEF